MVNTVIVTHKNMILHDIIINISRLFLFLTQFRVAPFNTYYYGSILNSGDLFGAYLLHIWHSNPIIIYRLLV